MLLLLLFVLLLIILLILLFIIAEELCCDPFMAVIPFLISLIYDASVCTAFSEVVTTGFFGISSG